MFHIIIALFLLNKKSQSRGSSTDKFLWECVFVCVWVQRERERAGERKCAFPR